MYIRDLSLWIQWKTERKDNNNSKYESTNEQNSCLTCKLINISPWHWMVNRIRMQFLWMTFNISALLCFALLCSLMLLLCSLKISPSSLAYLHKNDVLYQLSVRRNGKHLDNKIELWISKVEHNFTRIHCNGAHNDISIILAMFSPVNHQVVLKLVSFNLIPKRERFDKLDKFFD